METIILCTLFGVFILLAYTLGLRNGQKVSNNEEIKMPELNPVTVINKQIEKNEDKKKQEEYEEMLNQIDNYDGRA